jgi:hypothetical protein
MPGTARFRSSGPEIARFSRASCENAVTATGTVCIPSSRRRAVTTISPDVAEVEDDASSCAKAGMEAAIAIDEAMYLIPGILITASPVKLWKMIYAWFLTLN